MRNPGKYVACILALTMSVSSIAAVGCGNNPERSNEIVSADSLWYTTEKHELTLDYDTSEFDYIYSSPLGKVGDLYAIETAGSYMMSLDVDWETANYSDYMADYIDVFDDQGNHVNSIDLMDVVRDSGVLEAGEAYTQESDPDESESELADEDTEISAAPVSFDLVTVSTHGDAIDVMISVFDYRNYNRATMYMLAIDPVTGETSYEITETENDNGGYSEGIVSVGDYLVDRIWNSGSYCLKIYDSTGLINTVDLEEDLAGEMISYIDAVFCADEDVLLVAYNVGGPVGNDKYISVNVQTGEVTKDDDGEYSWINNYGAYKVSYFEGIGNVILTDDGIRVLDFDNKTLSDVFSFNCCNVNRYDISYMQLIEYTEDEISFIGTVPMGDTGMNELTVPQLIVLKKADSNPNAGKTILTAASISSVAYATCEAVCSFNETDPDYFIIFDDKYKTDNFIEDVDVSDSESAGRAYDNAAADLGNQLTIDLMAGDGPDIIFGASSFSQLNNDDYLLDISDRINTDGLFANVIEVAKTGDKLYQLPLTFGVTGLVVLSENLDAGQTGFTFDQYAQFVSTTCNGHDPLSSDQTEFFIMCMNAMSEQFITEDGKVDYNNEAFRALAEYTNENVIPPIDTGNGMDDGFGSTVNDMSRYGAARFEYSYFDAYIQILERYANESTIVGLPSIDGRGPLLSVNSSVAISSQTAEADACWRFVESLLSPDIQELYGAGWDGCPVNIAAYESSSRKAVDIYNEQMRLLAAYSTTGITEMDYAVVDRYEAMIESCSSVSATDPAITAIVREEMPAYFSGQKTLDDVISVMEDRVQTFLDERD
jgi:ABC-type glycerol-3-phosphate transport system substrate-binding protein